MADDTRARLTSHARAVLHHAHARVAQGAPPQGALLFSLARCPGVAGFVLQQVAALSAEEPRFAVAGSARSLETVLIWARDEARTMGHHYIGTEHLLMALLRRDRPAAALLTRHGLSPDQCERLIMETLGGVDCAVGPRDEWFPPPRPQLGDFPEHLRRNEDVHILLDAISLFDDYEYWRSESTKYALDKRPQSPDEFRRYVVEFLVGVIT